MEDRALPTQPLSAAWLDWARRLDRGWLLACAQVLVAAGAWVLYWPTTATLLLKWEPSDSTTYGHGYLIAAISFWLLIRNRSRLQTVAPRPSLPAGILLVLVSLLWLVMLRSGIQAAHQLLLPVIMWLALLTAFGPGAAFKSLFAIGYLFFALPIWDAANGLLQSATVVAAEVMLRVTHVNAYVDGNFVHLAAGVFEIAGGCSGMHFFIVALALAALYGEISDDTLKVRIQLLALAAALAVVTNWIRVYIIILAGYLTDMQHYLVRVEHYKFGWVVFAVTMTVFFLIARRLPAADSEPAPGSPICVVKKLRVPVARGLLISLAALALVPAWNLLAPLKAAAPPSQDALLPRNPGRWLGPDPSIDGAWQPVFEGAHLSAKGDYIDDGRRLSLFTAVYLQQVQGRELVGYRNSIAGEGVTVISEARIDVPVPVIEAVIKSRAGTAVVRYFYVVGGAATNRGVVAEVSYGLQSLSAAALSRVIAVRAACLPDCQSARAALDDLLQAIDGFPLNLSDYGNGRS